MVGDSADGYPGISGWGPKAAALAFSQYAHLEDVPKDWREWHPSIRRAQKLSESLFGAWNDAVLFRTLATLRLDVPVFGSLDELRWREPLPEFEKICGRMNAFDLLRHVSKLAGDRSRP
jgi:5'-3' exonuclease